MSMRFIAVTALLVAVSISARADEIVMKDSDIVIRESDIKRYIQDRLPESRWADYFQRPDAVHRLAENLYVIRALAREAENSGVLDQDLIDWQLELEEQRLEMNQYLNALTRQHTDSIDWEKTARDVYVAEPESFFRQEAVRAAHILVSTDDRSEEEALKLAEDIRQQLEDGADFKVMAAKHSDDDSVKTNLGSLGRFARGKMVPEFEEAAFALRKPGELAGPVKTKFGYHIIQLERYIPEEKRSFEEVKGEIIANLQREVPKKVRADKVTEVRSASDIEVNQEALDSLLEELRAEAAEY